MIVWKYKRMVDCGEVIGDKKTGTFTITLRNGASTTTKLHEYRHAQEKHYPDRMTLSRFVDRELDATLWSFTKMNRPVTWRTFIEVCEALICYGYEGRDVLYPVLGGLSRQGIVLSKEDRDNLLHCIETGEVKTWLSERQKGIQRIIRG